MKIKNITSYVLPAVAISALLLAGCSSDDDPAPGPSESQISPNSINSWDGVSFEFNPTIAIAGGGLTFVDGLELETEDATVSIPAGDTVPVLWERMSDTFGNLIADIGGGDEVRFTVGEFEGTSESISSFTLSVYYNDDPVQEYRNITASVVEGTLAPGGDNNPGDIEPIGELYTTIVVEKIVGSDGVGDLPDWEIGEPISVQLPGDFSQLTIFDDGDPFTLELAGDSGNRKDYFAAIMEDNKSFIITITLFVDGEDNPSMLTMVLNETDMTSGQSFMVTYELEF